MATMIKAVEQFNIEDVAPNTSSALVEQIGKQPGSGELKKEMGYGHSCFGRWCLRSENYGKPTGAELRVGSHGVEVPELNDFER